MSWDPMFGKRSTLLQAMHKLADDDPKVLSKVNGMWRHYRQEIEDAQESPGQARRHFEQMIWPTNEWKRFARLLDRRRQSTSEYKGWKAEYDRQRYKGTLKAKRANPAVKARANRLRRERYARKKLAANDAAVLEDGM